MIYKFNDFLLEFSSNSVFPELLKRGKKAIFLFGAPGVGKSYLSEKLILPRLKNYKIFDPDSFMITIKKIIEKGGFKNMEIVKKNIKEREEKIDDIKDAFAILFAQYNVEIYLSDEEIGEIVDNNLYIKGAYKLLEKVMFKFVETNNDADFIYDTTGNDFNRVARYTKKAKELGYKIIFIRAESSTGVAVKSNLKRKRKVEMDYQLYSLERSEQIDYLNLEPDAYYVYKRDENYLLKYYGGVLKKEKENIIKNG